MGPTNSQVLLTSDIQLVNGLVRAKATHGTAITFTAQSQYQCWSPLQQHAHTGADGPTSVPMQLLLPLATNPYGQTQPLITNPYEALEGREFHLSSFPFPRTGPPIVHYELPRLEVLHFYPSSETVIGSTPPIGVPFANVLYVPIVFPSTANAYFGGLAL